MRVSEIRDLAYEELLQKEQELKEELFNLRIRHSLGQVENYYKLKSTRRDVARVLTILKEKAANK